MGLRESVEYRQWRERRAHELIGPYATKTAGAYMSRRNQRTADGWIYGGRDAFCFFADNPLELAYLSPPGKIDQRTLVIAFQDCATPKVLSAPGAPNLILDFGGSREFAGAKGRMEHLLRLWQMWASGSIDPDLWRQTAEVSGLPLYKRPGRIPSNPRLTAIGALIGVIITLIGLAMTTTGSLNNLPTLMWLFVMLLLALGLLLVGRWTPNLVAGFVVIGTPGATIISVTLLTQSNLAAGLAMMATALLLIGVRLVTPRLSVRTTESPI